MADPATWIAIGSWWQGVTAFQIAQAVLFVAPAAHGQQQRRRTPREGAQ